jgi:hypothetical protein
MELRHEVMIEAPAAVVWEVLTDVDDYGAWNPFIRRLSGELRVGSRLEVEIRPPGRRSMTIKPRLLVVSPERELRWLGRLFLPGLFTGEHRFETEALSADRTRFVQSEQFRGVLVPVLGRVLRSTKQGFAAMDLALKSRAESVYAGAGT